MIELSIENIQGKNVFTFKYGNTCYFGEMGEENGKLVTNIPEKPARELMNLCMKFLRECKENTLAEERKIEPKIKFYGVDYNV